MNITGLVFFFALLLIAEGTSAFMCYTCSQASERCIKGNSEVKASNCSSSDDRKDMQKFCFITITGGKNEIYNRGCLIGDSKSFCEQEREKDPKSVCSICNKELCNSGNLKHVFKYYFIILFVIVAMFYY